MSVRTIRIGATLYFVMFALFVVWPLFVPFNHPLPLVLGLPFNMAAVAAWVAFGSVVLAVLDWSEERLRRQAPLPSGAVAPDPVAERAVKPGSVDGVGE